MRQITKKIFVRSKRATAAQNWALNTLGSKYCLAGKLPSFVPQDKELFLEIGFGSGEILLELAQAFPEHIFLGVEVYRAGVGTLLLQLERYHLRNVWVYPICAEEMLNDLPENTLSGVFILFPDPWPKTRHHKRRLIQPDFMELVKQKMKSAGFVRIITDWEGYALHIKKILENSSDWETSSEKKLLEQVNTRFFRKARQAGRPLWDFCIKKSSAGTQGT